MESSVKSGRRRVCLGCRTLLSHGETCGAKKGHEAVELDQPAQRARLDDEVWGPDSRARKLRRAAKAGASGGLFGGVLQGCSACDGLQALEGCGEVAGAGEGLIGVLFVLLAAIVAVVFVAGIVALVNLIRRRLDLPKPHGALRKPPKAAGRFNGAGTVSGGARIALPWKTGESTAYALELHSRSAFGGDALLRDAMGAGFDVALDDGRRVRIPPGRLTIVGKLPDAELERQRVDAFVADVEGSRGERPLFPYELARAATVNPGDRIDLLGELEMSADASSGHGYRANAGLLVPVGVPVLRIRRRADDDAHYRIAEGGGGAAEEAAAEDEAAFDEEAAAESTKAHVVSDVGPRNQSR